MPVLILTESELRACVGFDAQCLHATEDAFTWLSEGRVEMPPVMHIEVAEHHGDVDIKSACVRGLDHLAVKVASGFFDNPKLGLPSGGAMVVVLNAKTGFCEAVMLDNAYLTDLRTGLAGAVAARYLAPETVRTVGVLGSGAQARYQVRALRLVRDFERVLVSARDAGRTAAYAAEINESLGLPVEATTPDARPLWMLSPIAKSSARVRTVMSWFLRQYSAASAQPRRFRPRAPLSIPGKPVAPCVMPLSAPRLSQVQA